MAWAGSTTSPRLSGLGTTVWSAMVPRVSPSAPDRIQNPPHGYGPLATRLGDGERAEPLPTAPPPLAYPREAV